MLEYLDTISPFILAYAVLLVVAALALGLYAGVQSVSGWRELRKVVVSLEATTPVLPSGRSAGQTLEGWERLEATAAALPPRARSLWTRVANAVECYTAPEGQEGYFLTQPVASVLT